MPLYSLDGVAPEIAATVFVAPGAQVMGKVRIAAECSIWFNAVLRGDNAWISIGARSNVQELCMLHVDPGFPMEIGEDVTIGHGAIVHGCTVGDGVLIGMGATILNGARIGRGCLVGANALVTEGKEFPENTMIVGSPARAVRTLSPEQAAMGLTLSRHYVERARRFATGLVEITAESAMVSTGTARAGQVPSR